ncbi:hypothetical protein SUGI_1025400 [Cryptomeria japonica]|nr:hypothetical protein SUGI_1025400 [Cryptomeria japonica]
MNVIGKTGAWRRREVCSALLLCCLGWVIFGTVRSLSGDGEALIEFKKSVTGDPFGVFSNWNENDENPCSWNGVSCDSISGRVVGLSIRGQSGCASVGFGKGNGSVFAPCLLFRAMATSAADLSQGCYVREFVPESYSVGNFSLSNGVCLQNGTAVVNSLDGYSGQDRIACKLTGILSHFIGNLTELRVLSLPYNAFSGDIPREIGKLIFLEILDLQGNNFTGPLSPELGKLRFLRVLNLGYNMLVHSVPDELFACRKLETLDLTGNSLNGSAPKFLGSLPKLKVLSLSFNQFSGPIPTELADSCMSLEYLHLSGNLLTDEIPAQLGNCSQLRSLLLFSNFLEGSIPADIGRLPMLQILDVSRNSFSGMIPEALANCQQLSVLILSNVLNYALRNYTDVDPSSEFSNSDKDEYNYFQGELPASIFRLPQLQILWAPRTTLNGPLPENWGECSNLQILNLGQNFLTGKVPAGLGQCKKLLFLDLSSSRLTGEIPPELPVSCMSYFNVSGNKLTGVLPTFLNKDCPKQSLFPIKQYQEVLSNVSQAQLDPLSVYSALFHCGACASSSLPYLISEGFPVFHDFSTNNLTGTIPLPLMGDQLLEEQPSYGLLLNNNQFAGNISKSFFSSCSRLTAFALNISVNQISGEISPQLFLDCKSLKQLEASVNKITGPIPPTLGNLVSLRYLDLNKNVLQGSMPSQFGQLKDLQYLRLADNNLTGAIPREIGKISSIIVIELSSNSLRGEIPADLTKLKQLRSLLLDRNNLSGRVPDGFADLTALTVFNVSFNKLSGPLPQIGNKVSCDSFAGNHFVPPCRTSSSQQRDSSSIPLTYAAPPSGNPGHNHDQFNSIEIAAITSGSVIVFVLLVLVILFQYTRWRIPRTPGYRSGRKEVITFANIGVQLTYESVVRATGNFNAANFIGNGGFGATYKAELVQGLLVAVKRLSIGRFQGTQQFDAEIRTLGRVRHPNLVTLIGYHASEFKQSKTARSRLSLLSSSEMAQRERTLISHY